MLRNARSSGNACIASTTRQISYCILVLMLGGNTATSVAMAWQSTPSDAGKPQANAEDPPAPLLLNGIFRSAQSRVIPSGILAIGVQVENPTREVQTGLIVVSLDAFPNRQSVKPVSIVSRDTQRFTVPVDLPQELEPQQELRVTVSLCENNQDRSVMVDSEGKLMRSALDVVVDGSPSLAGLALSPRLLQNPFWVWPPKNLEIPHELAMTTPSDGDGFYQYVELGNTPLPAQSSDLDLIDAIIISRPESISDAAAREGLRKFLASGGKIWVQLDRVHVADVQPLLGPSQSVVEVDAAELSEIDVELVQPDSMVVSDELKRTFRDPVQFKRIIQSGGKVSHRIGRWPVAVTMQVGHGEILFTTLEARAWTTVRQNTQESNLTYQNRTWGNGLATIFSDTGVPPKLDAIADAYVMDKVGNPVVRKRSVVMALGGFVALLALLGVWQGIGGDLKRIGFLAPIASLIVAGSLVGVGAMTRATVPNMVAKFQRVQLSGDGQVAAVTENAAVYLQDGSQMTLQGAVDGHATVQDLNSGLATFESRDFQNWALSNEAWPAGAWKYTANYSLPTESLVAIGRLDEQGMLIELPNSVAEAAEDGIFHFVRGKPLFASRENNGFRVNDLMAARDKWTSDTLVSDEQQSRAQVYNELLLERRNVAERRFYFWRAPLEDGPTWDAGYEVRGTALFDLPIRLEKPSDSQRILIPSGMVRLDFDSRVPGFNAIFIPALNRWSDEASRPMRIYLEFQLPPEALPFQADEVTLKLKMSAPFRTVNLYSSMNSTSEATLLATLENPSLPWEQTFTDGDLLTDAMDGRIGVVVDVSDRNDLVDGEEKEDFLAWSISSFELEARGKRELDSDK